MGRMTCRCACRCAQIAVRPCMLFQLARERAAVDAAKAAGALCKGPTAPSAVAAKASSTDKAQRPRRCTISTGTGAQRRLRPGCRLRQDGICFHTPPHPRRMPARRSSYASRHARCIAAKNARTCMVYRAGTGCIAFAPTRFRNAGVPPPQRKRSCSGPVDTPEDASHLITKRTLTTQIYDSCPQKKQSNVCRGT
jgi:hypothetical protein